MAEAWRHLSELAPGEPTFAFNAGVRFQEAGKLPTAVDLYRKAIAVRPGYIEAMSNLAMVLGSMQSQGEALVLMSDLEARGQLADALKPLYAHLLIKVGQISRGEAVVAEVERTEAGAGVSADARSRDRVWMRYIAAAKADLGRIDEAIALGGQYCEACPLDAVGCASMLATSQYFYPDDPAAHLERHRRFETLIASTVPPLPPTEMKPLDGRRLRVGYVSPDFRAHSVGGFIEPLILNHDTSRIEIHCFSSSNTADALTARLKTKAHRWHDVYLISDDDLASLVRACAIDVLIDLAGHTTGSRLSAFGRRPAPVQLTYLGYSSTTGLAAIDGLITDAVCDPPGESDSHFTERLLRMPEVLAVFRPPRGAPEVAPPSYRETGRVTLGCVAALSKINDGVLDAWCAGMRASPDTQLLMIGMGRGDAVMQQRLRERFAARGIESDRLAFVGQVPFERYIELLGAIDLMLDTFPFTGHTTTVQNLWMGVPVVTYAGRSHRSRMTASVLTSIGLPELIANSEEAYGPLIARWANDPESIIALRASLRERMQNSPLMNESRFARDFEDLLVRAFETKRALGHV